MCILLRLVPVWCQELCVRYACNMDRSCAGIVCLGVLGMAARVVLEWARTSRAGRCCGAAVPGRDRRSIRIVDDYECDE